MPQRITKIIVFVLGLIIIIGVFIFALCSSFNKQKSTDQKLIAQCEKKLDIPKNIFGTPPIHTICKVEKNNIKQINTAQNTSDLKPNDTVIISLNLQALINAKWNNPYNATTTSKPKNNEITICFVVYPVLMKDYMINYTEQEYNSFYSHYLWKIYPSDILNLDSKGDNFICTKSQPINGYRKVSILLKIPSTDDLIKGYNDTRSYGIKVVLVPEELNNSNLTSDIIINNYSKFDTLYLLLKSIKY